MFRPHIRNRYIFGFYMLKGLNILNQGLDDIFLCGACQRKEIYRDEKFRDRRGLRHTFDPIVPFFNKMWKFIELPAEQSWCVIFRIHRHHTYSGQRAGWWTQPKTSIQESWNSYTTRGYLSSATTRKFFSWGNTITSNGKMKSSQAISPPWLRGKELLVLQ